MRNCLVDIKQKAFIKIAILQTQDTGQLLTSDTIYSIIYELVFIYNINSKTY